MEAREMIQVSDTVRVENGPALREAIATPELLDNSITKAHYQVGAQDAMGKVIALGETMQYLDYFAPFVWYIYQHNGERYLELTARTNKAEALTFAATLEA
jgi:hypothetical protein